MKTKAGLHKMAAGFLRWLYPFLIFVGVMVAVSHSLDEPNLDTQPSPSFSVLPLQ